MALSMCSVPNGHGTFDDPRCNKAVMCQTGDECLCAPCPEGCAHVQAFSARTSAALAGHVGLYGGFINEDDLLGLSGNGRQPPAEPGMSSTSHMGFSTFVRDEALFLYVNPSRRSKASESDAAAGTSLQANKGSKSCQYTSNIEDLAAKRELLG
jgi:hypothetical protein